MLADLQEHHAGRTRVPAHRDPALGTHHPALDPDLQRERTKQNPSLAFESDIFRAFPGLAFSWPELVEKLSLTLSVLSLTDT